MEKIVFDTIDQYIAQFDPPVQDALQHIRRIIAAAAPQATETISYNMPAFAQNGVLVYFAAAKHHVGFYPTAAPIVQFAAQLADYKTSKGAVQFPYSRPLPDDLIADMVRYRVAQHQLQLAERALKKRQTKSK